MRNQPFPVAAVKVLVSGSPRASECNDILVVWVFASQDSDCSVSQATLVKCLVKWLVIIQFMTWGKLDYVLYIYITNLDNPFTKLLGNPGNAGWGGCAT